MKQTSQPDDMYHRIGPWLDGELSPQEAAEFEQAMQSDPVLAAEVEQLKSMTERIAQLPQASLVVPPWSQLKARLDLPSSQTIVASPQSGRSVIGWIRRHARFAAAACVALVLIGVLSIGLIDRTSHAATVDFGPLLSAQETSLDAGLADFLRSVNAKAIDVPPRSDLHFDPLGPQSQGRKLVQSYQFHLAGKPAYCFVYQDTGPGIVIIQCPPDVNKLHGKWQCDHGYDLGSHREHMVEMGTWRLAHLERPGFCVCVFSTLPPKTELPVLVATLNVR